MKQQIGQKMNDVPNKETAKEIRESRERKKVVKCKNIKDLFKKLRI